MRVQVAYPLVAVLISSSAYVLTACSNDEGTQVETLPQSPGRGGDAPVSEGDDGEGANPSSPLASVNDGGAIPDASAGDAGSHADAGENDGGTQCNELTRQPTDAPYYVLYNDATFPDFKAYSGGAIRDGEYVLAEDRSYLGYPRTPDGGASTGTSWTTLKVTGNHLSAIVTDHEGGEERFNATIELDGSRIYLTPLCGLDSQTTKNEWRELKFPFIKSGYEATDDTLRIGWMIGNHAAVAKVFHRVQGPPTTWESR